MGFDLRLAACGSVALLVGLAGPARAQQVDYGALEQMFGQPVTTSATGSPQLAALAPADMQIITADDIRRSGAITIPDILQFVAGIDVRPEGALGADVAIRGFSQSFNPRLLVLVNGRQVYIDDYGYVAWQAIPVQLSDIRQIEIVRGPASALFGFNAVSGVINIITYDPLNDKTNVATAGYGTDGTVLGSLVSTVQEPGKGGVTISLGGIRTNEFSDRRSLLQGYYDAKPNLGNISIDGRWKPTDRTEVTAEVTDSSTDSSGNDDGTPGTSNYRVQSAKAGFSADTPAGSSRILQAPCSLAGSMRKTRSRWFRRAISSNSPMFMPSGSALNTARTAPGAWSIRARSAIRTMRWTRCGTGRSPRNSRSPMPGASTIWRFRSTVRWCRATPRPWRTSTTPPSPRRASIPGWSISPTRMTPSGRWWGAACRRQAWPGWAFSRRSRRDRSTWCSPVIPI
jgi:outer membrane receptor protein involved in Fe transport